MGTLVRLRILLSDRPGALAAVAALIAARGGNITAIDVQPAADGEVIDDLVVDLPPNVDVDDLRRDLAAENVATLLSHQAAQVADPVVSALNLAVEQIEGDGVDPDGELVRAVSAICGSPAVWLNTPVEPSAGPTDPFALDAVSNHAHGVFAERTQSLPPEMAERLPGEALVLSFPDPDEPAGGRIVYVARPVDHGFTTTEIARIEAVITLHNAISRRLPAR